VVGNGAVAELRLGRKGCLDGPLLVGVAAGQPVRLVGPERHPEGVLARALPDLGLNRRQARLAGGLDAVEAVGEPVVGAVEVHLDGREVVARPHPLGVLTDGVGVDGGPRLRAAVGADGVERQVLQRREGFGRLRGHRMLSLLPRSP